MIPLVREGVTKPMWTEIIRNEGMPHHNFPSQKGDMHVLHKIRFPEKLTSEQQEMVEKLLGDDDAVRDEL